MSDQTFLFADLAGFTALTEAHGDTEAADLAARFCMAVSDILPPDGAETIKTLGDAVMVRVDDARGAVELAVRIVREVGARPGLPSVRVGMHTGPAIERDGDWFGATVNTAARVSALARSDEVLLTASTRAAAGALDAVAFAEHGRHELKNVAERVLLYRAVPKGFVAGELPVDPVCRMAVDPESSAGTLIHAGAEYHFCSLRCAQSFSADPERHVPREADAGRRAGIEHVLAAVQGGGYMTFGLWALALRSRYRRVHRLTSEDWLLNAHAGWLSVVGGVLMTAAVRRRRPTPELRALGFGSAAALAANDAVMRRRTARVYDLDLAYESLLSAGWVVAVARRDR